MSWLSDLLGNLLQVAGSNVARRRIWNYLNGPTVTDDAANSRLNVDYTNVRVQEREVSFTDTDLIAALPSQLFNIGAILPDKAHVLGTEIELATPFTGGGAAWVNVDFGSAGDSDALVDDGDLFTAAVDGQASRKPDGIAPNKSFATATQLAAAVSSNVNLDQITAGSCTLRVLFCEIP